MRVRVTRLTGWIKAALPRRSFPWVIVGILVALAPVVGILAFLAASAEYRETPPTCYGIGWGCTLSAPDVGVLMGSLWAFAVAVIAIVLGVTEFFWERIAELRSIVLLVLLGLGAVAMLWFVLG